MFFQQPYDKIVVLPSNQLQSSSSKRGLGASSDMIHGARDSTSAFRNQFAQPGDQPWFCYWNGTILEGFIYVTENTTFASGNNTSLSSTAAPSATATYNSPSSPSSTSVTNNYVQQPQWVPPYPRVIKIEERRLMDNAIKPYCIQMQVLDDGGINSVPDSSGNPITIQLDEYEPPAQNSVQLGPKKRETRSNDFFASEGDEMRKRQSESDCHCEWLST